MSMAIKYAMKKRMAKGGKVESDMSGGQKRGPEGYPKYQEQAQNEKGIHTPRSGITQFPHGKGRSEAGDFSSATYDGKPHEDLREHGKELHRKKLAEMRSMKKPNLMAEGGEMHGDMVDRIMQRRCYSKGGMVANGGDADLDEMADGRDNNFDDLALRDDLEFAYTGANSGDELGNEQEDQDRHDIVARIMRSRAKKDRNPRPA